MFGSLSGRFRAAIQTKRTISTMVKARKFLFNKEFSGTPNDSNFKLVTEELPPLKDGEVLFEATFLSVDPYMRVFPQTVGSVAIGEQVTRISESRNKSYTKGDEYLGSFGWRSHTICNPDAKEAQAYSIRKIPALGDLPHSLALGVVGMPGVTAYNGMLKEFDIKPGSTVLTSGSAGAVGSIVGQLAKIKGCTVIGYAGSDVKVQWLKELGFDKYYNYKKTDLSKSLSEAAPDGIDFYFDTVGGKFASTVILNHMKEHGKVLTIGSISTYNEKEPPVGPMVLPIVVPKRLKIHGMVVYDLPPEKWNEAFTYLIKCIREGKLKYKEHVTEGFENTANAFFGLFKGEPTGKSVVKVI